MGVNYNTRIPTNGLMLHLDAANTKSYSGSGNTWNDLSGYGNHVVANGATYSFANKAMEFSGSLQYFGADSVTLPSGNSAKTMICWVNPYTGNITDSYVGLMSYGGRSCPTGLSVSTLLSMSTPSNYYVSSAYWCNDYVPNSTNLINKDSWNMVGIIARGTSTTNNTTLFLFNSNGFTSITGTSSSYTKVMDQYSQNLRIGCTDTTGGRAMKGLISTASIYNRELSVNEIMLFAEAFRGRYGI